MGRRSEPGTIVRALFKWSSAARMLRSARTPMTNLPEKPRLDYAGPANGPSPWHTVLVLVWAVIWGLIGLFALFLGLRGFAWVFAGTERLGWDWGTYGLVVITALGALLYIS